MNLSSIDFQTILIFSAIFFVLFALAEIGYRVLKLEVGYTRKFVHVCTGIIVLFFPFYFQSPIDLILICVSFFIVLTVSKRIGMIPSINAIQRKSRGSTLYPVVVVICYLVQYALGKYVYFFIPILILALADPMAEFSGRKFKYKPYSIFNNSKTLSGSLGFFIVSLITSIFGMYYFSYVNPAIMILCAFSIGLLTTIGEAVSFKGYDNLIIPLCAILGLYIFGI